MSCPDEEDLSAYADGELEQSRIEMVERHVAACVKCRESVDAMTRTGELAEDSLRSIPVVAQRASSAARAPHRPVRGLVYAVAAVIVLALLAAGWLAEWHLTRPNNHPAGGVSQNGVAVNSGKASDYANNKGVLRMLEGPRFYTGPDDAFERWAQAYRNLRVPLVPMDQLADFKPRDDVPFSPVTTRSNGENQGGVL